VKRLVKRALCAALTVGLMPAAPAAAEAVGSSASPAVASADADARSGARKSVLVDAASAVLYMLEDGQIVDSMKVIVGKDGSATPELKTALIYTTLNPYWHVPTDIARTLTAPNVLEQGTRYLEERGYEVVSSFGSDAEVLDPASVDWQAVAEGHERVFVRQRPGQANSMGEMKFMLASGNGIFLHDTPKKELFEQEQRALSAGCIRLADAPRFARWLLGEEVTVASQAPEQHIALERMVPITITYLDGDDQLELAALR
jgi:L,D-transpeptidase YcbB